MLHCLEPSAIVAAWNGGAVKLRTTTESMRQIRLVCRVCYPEALDIPMQLWLELPFSVGLPTEPRRRPLLS